MCTTRCHDTCNVAAVYTQYVRWQAKRSYCNVWGTKGSGSWLSPYCNTRRESRNEGYRSTYSPVCIRMCMYVCVCMYRYVYLCVPTLICRLTHWNHKKEIRTNEFVVYNTGITLLHFCSVVYMLLRFRDSDLVPISVSFR